MLFLANNLKASICCFSLFYRCFCNFHKEQSPQGAPGEGGGGGVIGQRRLFYSDKSVIASNSQ